MASQDPSNRRRSERLPAHLVVAVQPVNSAHRPQGDRLDAVSIDLSQGGVCFLCDHPLLTDLAIIELQAATSKQSFTLLAERVRCRRNGPMFEIAVKFVEKFATA